MWNITENLFWMPPPFFWCGKFHASLSPASLKPQDGRCDFVTRRLRLALRLWRICQVIPRYTAGQPSIGYREFGFQQYLPTFPDFAGDAGIVPPGEALFRTESLKGLDFIRGHSRPHKGEMKERAKALDRGNLSFGRSRRVIFDYGGVFQIGNSNRQKTRTRGGHGRCCGRCSGRSGGWSGLRCSGLGRRDIRFINSSIQCYQCSESGVYTKINKHNYANTSKPYRFAINRPGCEPVVNPSSNESHTKNDKN